MSFGIEAGDSGAGAPRSVRIEESEIGLQKLAVLNHVLLTGAFRHDLVPVARKETLDHVPGASELREQRLTGTRRVRRLILLLRLLRESDCRRGNNRRRGNPFLHGTPMVYETREHGGSALQSAGLCWAAGFC